MTLVPSERDYLINYAQITLEAECIVETMHTMHKIIQLNPRLTQEERNLLLLSYRLQISPKFTSWQKITQLYDKEKKN